MYRTRNLPFFVSESAWHSDVNALGSNIVLTGDDQNVLVRYEYDVFGAMRSEVGTSDNTRKFTGAEYESDVKLYCSAAVP